MALVSAMHETEGKVRKSIQGDSALKELEKVKAICAVARPKTLTRQYSDAHI